MTTTTSRSAFRTEKTHKLQEHAMEFKDLPKAIKDHYGNANQIDRIHLIPDTGRQYHNEKGFNITLIGMATDRWRYAGQKGARKWTRIG